MRADAELPSGPERGGVVADGPAAALVLVLAAAVAAACGPASDGGADGTRDRGQRRDTMARDAGGERSIHEALAAHREAWMARPEVTGTGIGRCGEEPCIVVYLLRRTEEVEAALPDSVGGHRVRLEVTGRFEAGGGPDGTKEEPG